MHNLGWITIVRKELSATPRTEPHDRQGHPRTSSVAWSIRRCPPLMHEITADEIVLGGGHFELFDVQVGIALHDDLLEQLFLKFIH